ncbi:nuclear transport factor 2 family protein [Kamptonema animale CS-326]|jgi:ketosteroid isomerase-like protein|uniref:nuclear transport factor 2 family protein n=1 Tax=Kamptonema animale TaxID=92934 RepID=UPI00232ACA11|nr:nuclear transport factor 2 family protein [Kamptonema animale]MDB9512494.1 nuclear transport factor 2 family protein [Kamptonema animale CS-326]
MRNPLNSLPNISKYFPDRFSVKDAIASPLVCLSSLPPLFLSLTIGGIGLLNPSPVKAQGALAARATIIAQTPTNAPAELTKLLSEIDAAANSRNVKALMKFYSQNFTNSDGLNRQSMEKAIKQFWQSYSTLKYTTELKSWKAEGNAFIAETETTITGTQKIENREMKLKSTIRSQQRFEEKRIVKQEILAERNQLTSGENPPTIQMNLPEQVNVGQEYNFDAIVQEPLGNDILIGTALEEPISEKTFFSTSPVELELLASGGVFKVGKAPETPENRWISAILMRQGGITVITQRLRVVK